METLANRLDVCQDKMLELYEKDSNKLEDQIMHWQLMRVENALLYKARECGLTHIGHQVVPPLSVTKAKARSAIEVHVALLQLQESAYAQDSWTLRDTSREMWDTVPKKCWKKRGVTVEVRYDGDETKSMCYVHWRDIFTQNYSDDKWVKVAGHVSYEGLYYIHEGEQTFYVKFKDDAYVYGETGKWEVHVGGKVIHHHAFDPVSSTREIPAAGPLCTGDTTKASTETSVGATEGPQQKRQRLETLNWEQQQRQYPQTPSTQTTERASQPLDVTRTSDCDTTCPYTVGHPSDPDCAPVVHLKGDPNCLKCFRYRLHKGKRKLYCKTSSTWRWSCESENQAAFVTIWYTSYSQRNEFLSTVKVPPGIQVILGHMSMFV
ncbi:regulatory protein E2 [Human papillomavirus 28]|uniref:Regulatory protein E2 n=1 Tax=Human papillomavirus 28 TaxID=37111 RepID=VE2_HPV28|nr:RecName: Full=Regulatory protein E2 [Human papillomavirus 28]AAA79425.1 regulatory protein E2 [Human papillomavirus 28]